MPIILGIETSCDETSAAVLEGTGNDVKLRSLVILSQDVHKVFGGVVPELLVQPVGNCEVNKSGGHVPRRFVGLVIAEFLDEEDSFNGVFYGSVLKFVEPVAELIGIPRLRLKIREVRREFPPNLINRDRFISHRCDDAVRKDRR